MEPANNAGSRETLIVGDQEGITRCLCAVTQHGTQPLSSIPLLQAGMAVGQVSPDQSPALRE
jgi:hypothetical protein